MSLHDEPLSDERAVELLETVIERAQMRAPEAIVVFDLDSTLLDNSPRQSRIMREYGQEHDIAALAANRAEHWAGWDSRVAMRNSGLDEARIEQHAAAFKAYWFQRFFTSEYCVDDQLVPGADRYTAALVPTGAKIFYVTGRNEPMRRGTVECLDRLGFPIPDRARVELVMKPSLDEPDDGYKARTHARLHRCGIVVAAFDNEPTHINGYRESFPHALSVHLATDHSLRDIRVLPGIPSIRDFAAFGTR